MKGMSGCAAAWERRQEPAGADPAPLDASHSVPGLLHAQRAVASGMEGDSDLAAFLVGLQPPACAAGASPWRMLPPAVSPTVQALNRAFAHQAVAAAAAAAAQGISPSPAATHALPVAPGRRPPGSPLPGWSPAGARLSRLRPLYPSTPAPAQPPAAALSAQALPLSGSQQGSPPFVPAVIDRELAAELQAQARQVLALAAAEQQAQHAGSPPFRAPATGGGGSSGAGQGSYRTAANKQGRDAAEEGAAGKESALLRRAAAAAVAAAGDSGAQLRALELILEAGSGGAVLQVGWG